MCSSDLFREVGFGRDFSLGSATAGFDVAGWDAAGIDAVGLDSAGLDEVGIAGVSSRAAALGGTNFIPARLQFTAFVTAVVDAEASAAEGVGTAGGMEGSAAEVVATRRAVGAAAEIAVGEVG